MRHFVLMLLFAAVYAEAAVPTLMSAPGGVTGRQEPFAFGLDEKVEAIAEKFAKDVITADPSKEQKAQ